MRLPAGTLPGRASFLKVTEDLTTLLFGDLHFPAGPKSLGPEGPVAPGADVMLLPHQRGGVPITQ